MGEQPYSELCFEMMNIFPDTKKPFPLAGVQLSENEIRLRAQIQSHD